MYESACWCVCVKEREQKKKKQIARSKKTSLNISQDFFERPVGTNAS